MKTICSTDRSGAERAPENKGGTVCRAAANKNPRAKANRDEKQKKLQAAQRSDGGKTPFVPPANSLADKGMEESQREPTLIDDLSFYHGLLVGQKMGGAMLDAWFFRMILVFRMLGWRILEDIDAIKFRVWYERQAPFPTTRDDTDDGYDINFIKDMHYFVGTMRELSALPPDARNKLKALDRTLRVLLEEWSTLGSDL